MKAMRRVIDRYAAQLMREGMMLSVHFRAEIFCSFAIEDVEFLQKYNIHILPYCTCVKGRQQVQCAAENQRAIGNGTVPYVRICPAGVAEYHQTFSRFGEFVGVVTVSLGRAGILPDREPDRTLFAEMHRAPDFVGRLDSGRAIPPSIDAVDAKITPLCWMLRTYFEQLNPEETPSATGRMFRQIQLYLQENHTDVSLKALCSHFHCSESHISHLFKQHAGCSLRQYCNRLRLLDAKKLLRHSGLSVTEIAQMLGYSDTSYFIRFFRDATGKTPRKWRICAEQSKKMPVPNAIDASDGQ